MARHGLHVAEAEIGLEVALAAVFDAFEHRPDKGERGSDHRLRLLVTDEIQPQSQQKAGRQGEHGNGQQGGGEEGVLPVKNL